MTRMRRGTIGIAVGLLLLLGGERPGVQAQSGPLTQFGRPEDGAWDPSNPGRYYFITTGTPTQPTRLWAMDYYDFEHPSWAARSKFWSREYFPTRIRIARFRSCSIT